MTLKKNKGYSLIEIGVGIIIITSFLLFSIALFNACYNTYRRINQRSLAIDYAVKLMEMKLQEDSAVTTGFYDEITNEPVDAFYSFVEGHLDSYKVRYSNAMGISESSFNTSSILQDDIVEYINKDRTYLINRFIESNALSSSSIERLESGDYCFFDNDGVLINNLDSNKTKVEKFGNIALLEPIYPELLSDDDRTNNQNYSLHPNNSNTLAALVTIRRIPAKRISSTEIQLYGNEVLNIKVEVFYTKKLDYINLKKEDVESIVIESVKTDI